MSDDALIQSLVAAVTARPEDLPLRLHLAELLVAAGRREEAVQHLATALAQDPGNAAAQSLMATALATPAERASQRGTSEERSGAERAELAERASESAAAATASSPTALPESPASSPEPNPTAAPGDAAGSVDWAALEEQFADSVPPRFTDGAPDRDRVRADDRPDPVTGDADRIFDIETSTIRLADVGGMTEVKKRLEVAFLAPLRNDRLRALYRKSLRGGLLLYGPPGCGKTFLARALAGELGAKFISISLTDVLNMWVGASERNLHEIFQAARRNAPCVLFLDEVDALGHKRSQLQSSAMRTLGNQLLAELDGMEGDNEGVFVLAATNAPWDVDAALRRPGRFDRTVLVTPPDAAARAAIIEYHLRDRPIAGIDLKRLADRTERFSGADLSHLCETAAEYAMHDSVVTGNVRMIEQRDFEAALREVKPTTGPWLATARNVALFANENGAYDDLARYLKKEKII